MGTVTLYGQLTTRAMRTYWMLRELGIDFRVEQLVLGSEKMRKHSPMNKQPCLRDSDGTVVFESLAINLYLARRYADANPDLCPQSQAEEAKTLSLSFFAMTELDPRLFEIVFHHPMVKQIGHPLTSPPQYLQYFGRRMTETRALRLCGELQRPLDVLEASLAHSNDYLAGDRFTVVDLNVSAVMAWAMLAPVDLLGTRPLTQAWLARCMARPKSPQSERYPSGQGTVRGWTKSSRFVFDQAMFDDFYAKIGYEDHGGGAGGPPRHEAKL